MNISRVGAGRLVPFDSDRRPSHFTKLLDTCIHQLDTERLRLLVESRDLTDLLSIPSGLLQGDTTRPSACNIQRMQAVVPTATPGSADLARYRFVQGEIEAGLVFAAGAIEYQWTNPRRAETLRADAEDCFLEALKLVRQGDVVGECPFELELMLLELQQRLDLLREAERVSSTAA